MTLSTSLITRKELKVYGSRNSAGEFEEALAGSPWIYMENGCCEKTI